MKRFFKWFFLIGFFYIVGTILLIHFFPNWFLPSIEEQRKEVIYFYRTKNFVGIVSNVFIDSSMGLSKTVVIREKKMTTNNSFDFDSSGLYEFLKIGDSIKKNKGDLFVKIKRGNLDTIINFNLGFDVEKFEREHVNASKNDFE